MTAVSYNGSSCQDLELDEDDLWGDQKGSGSDSESESESDSSSRSRLVACYSDGSGSDEDDVTGTLSGALPAGRLSGGGTSSTAVSFDNVSARAAAAQALAAKHPGMTDDGDSSISLTRPIPSSAHRRRTMGGMGPQTRGEAAMAEAAAKLGSSVPIAIPMAARDQKLPGKKSPTGPTARAATFVPPHLLEQRAGGAHATSASLHGTSPTASLKRVRLQNRDNILRSIGFLEETRGINGISDTMEPIREAATEDVFSSSPAGFSMSPSISSFSGASGLSSALKSARIGY